MILSLKEIIIGWWRKFFRQPSKPEPVLLEATPPPEAAPPPPPQRDVRIRNRMALRGMAQARRKLADQIHDVLGRIRDLDLRRGDSLGSTVEAQAVGELLGCDLYWLGAEVKADLLNPGYEFAAFNPTQDDNAKELADICWPIDTALITRKDPGNNGDLLGGYFISRVRSVTPKEARGRAQYFLPKMVRVCHMKIFDDASWYAEDNIIGLMNGRWQMLDRNLHRRSLRGGSELELVMLDTPQIRQEVHESTAMTMSLALTRRYTWHVALGPTKTGTRILLPTNPTGCLQFFKDREKGNRDRRAALRHWVSRHYRNTDETGLLFVREHLRGATEFSWSDLECEIYVSAFDLEKNEAFRLEAELWRSQRKHNSVRVKMKRRKG
jgi:hypothetical protein